jgi:hypothetical protein
MWIVKHEKIATNNVGDKVAGKKMRREEKRRKIKMQVGKLREQHFI